MRYASHSLGRHFPIAPIRFTPGHRQDDNKKFVKATRERKLMAKLNINGTIRDVEAEPETPLLWVIREQVGLTGTKYGCGVAQCGACSVHINDEVQRSCSIRVGDVAPATGSSPLKACRPPARIPCRRRGRRSTCRNAAIASPDRSWPLRRCSRRIPKPSDQDIDQAMTNICRCGTYQRVRSRRAHGGQRTHPEPEARPSP